MATAWRGPANLLSRYLEEAAARDAAAPAEEQQAAPAPAWQDEDEDDEGAASPPRRPPPPPPGLWWASLRGRLARQGIVVTAADNTTGLAPSPPPAFLALVRGVEQYHTRLRAVLRLLQGGLALRCGRGVSVPMVPLLTQHKAKEEAEEDDAFHQHSLALSALRALLLQSIARASRAVVATACVGEKEGEEGEEEEDTAAAWAPQGGQVLLELAQQGTKGNLLHVQMALQAWAVLVGEALPRLLRRVVEEEGKEKEEKETAYKSLRQVLREEGACLVEAFGLRREKEEDETTTSSSSSSFHSLQSPPHRPLKARLQAMGRRLALGRAQLESRLARLFLQQCALVDVLRRMEEEEEEEEGVLCLGLERLQAGWEEACREEEEALRTSVELGANAELADVQAMLAGLVGGTRKEEEEEEVVATGEREAEIVVEGGGGGTDEKQHPVQRRDDRGEYETGGPVAAAAALGKEKEEEEVVLEVFEGTSTPLHKAQEHLLLHAHQQQQHRQHQRAAAKHGALMGELGRVLTGRRQRGGPARVRVNGQLRQQAEEEEEEEEAAVDARKEGPCPPAPPPPVGLGSTLLAALLQRQVVRSQKEEEGNVDGVYFDGAGEGGSL